MFNKHPAIVLQYGTGNLIVMKCAQHGTHLVLGRVAPVTSACHFEVKETAELLRALEAGPIYDGLYLDERPDQLASFHHVSGGGWLMQVLADEPDVTWFSFAAPAPSPAGDPVALNTEGRRTLRAAVLEVLYGKEARA